MPIILPHGFLGQSGGNVSDITVISTDSFEDTGIIIPNTVQAGDILFAIDGAGAGMGNPPIGFTLLQTFTPNSIDIPMLWNLSYKIAVGNEGNSDVGTDGGFFNDSFIFVLRPNGAVSSVDNVGWVSRPTHSNPASIVLNNSGGKTPQLVIGIFMSGDGTPFSPRNFFPASDGEMTEFFTYVQWKVYNSSPINTAIDMDDEGDDNWLLGGWLEFN